VTVNAPADLVENHEIGARDLPQLQNREVRVVVDVRGRLIGVDDTGNAVEPDDKYRDRTGSAPDSPACDR
jgi:hypothetical protein